MFNLLIICHKSNFKFIIIIYKSILNFFIVKIKLIFILQIIIRNKSICNYLLF